MPTKSWKKPPQKVAYLYQLGEFFFSVAPTAPNSPELHFRFINSFIQSSLLRSLLAMFYTYYMLLYCKSHSAVLPFLLFLFYTGSSHNAIFGSGTHLMQSVIYHSLTANFPSKWIYYSLVLKFALVEPIRIKWIFEDFSQTLH